MIVMKFGGTSVADAAAMTRSIGIVEGKLKQKPKRSSLHNVLMQMRKYVSIMVHALC